MRKSPIQRPVADAPRVGDRKSDLGGAANDQAQAFVDLLGILRESDYRFVTPTPATHSRWLRRANGRTASNLEEALGWNLPFSAGALGECVEAALHVADALETMPGELSKSRVRVSALGGHLYVHSGFPTEGRDAVFLGPDSYRFANLVRAEVAGDPPRAGSRVADIGTGAGVGAVLLAACCPDAHVIATDINPAALRFAGVNLAAAEAQVELVHCNCLEGVAGDLDLIIANPPYIIDEGRRTYRDGGGMHGGALSLEIARAGLKRLAPGGRMILYTGSAIVAGDDALHRSLVALACEHGAALRYQELDPDVFGEELERPSYADVDRIAIVAAILVASADRSGRHPETSVPGRRPRSAPPQR